MAAALSPKSKFLVLGRAGMDLYADPPGTEVENATGFSTALGGSSGNIAAGLARHGLATGLLSCVSQDAVGRFVRNELERYGIDARHVRVLEGESRTSLAVTETRIENTQNTLYRNNASDLLMSEEQVLGVDFENYDALIVTGTALAGNPSRSATLRAMEHARNKGATVVLDLDYRPYSWVSSHEAAETYRAAIEASDIVVGNDDEFAVVANGTHDDGRRLAAELGQGDTVVVYKMGEKGSVVFSRDGSFETGIFRVEAIKPMGAGDAFMASLMAGLATGKTLRQAVLAGSAAAAMVVSRIGCAPAMPTPAELDEFLNNNTAPQT
ncbi:MAG: 5-dehydro-2-deoxygluconokinase [Roseibium sp.]|uniref:5-dehydro-2-deoxygluconokinase n=1 Tax=Roseibium sp. TaxID=1936156 RepID=UPI001B05B9D9|nr:5-dehydro-2-deoxygluconokinase [Roseibium sp.]MBO6895403.1 5-dehydro-2-deoxygluconokinase [Roseibium sp.]MBO6932714.1 5-dehydro-2-deoxygluconokinase [Roseibium sp.]